MRRAAKNSGAILALLMALWPSASLSQSLSTEMPIAPPRPEPLPLFCEAYSGDTVVFENNSLRVEAIQSPVTPQLNIAGPTYALWSGVNIAGPLYFFVSTNYLSFIDRFELSIYRGGDSTAGQPIKTFTGAAVDLLDPIAWNGELDVSGEIRPGETFSYVLRVFDKYRNMDQTTVRSFAVQRYLRPTQRAQFSKEKEVLLAEFDTTDHVLYRQISAAGYPFQFKDSNTDTPLQSISGIILSESMRRGITQILLPGEYIFSVNGTDRESMDVQGQCENRLEISTPNSLDKVSGKSLLKVLRDAPVGYHRLGYHIYTDKAYPVEHIADKNYIIIEQTSNLASWPTNQIKEVVLKEPETRPASQTIMDYNSEKFDLSTGARLFTLKASKIREQSLQVIALGLETPVVLLRNIHYTYYAPKGWISLTESGEEYIGANFQSIEVSYKSIN